MSHSILIKLAITAATDKRTYKMIVVIIAAVLAPIILLVMMMLMILYSGTELNKETALYCFSEETLPFAMPTEQKTFINTARKNLSKLETSVNEKENTITENSFDINKIKAIFLSLQEQIVWSDEDYAIFVNCFIIKQITETDDGERTIYYYNTDLTSVLDDIKTAFSNVQITHQHIEFINCLYEYLQERNNELWN